MGAVVLGMTVLQLSELIAAVDGGMLSLIKIHDALVADGKKDTDPVPPDSVTHALNELVAAINAKLPIPLR